MSKKDQFNLGFNISGELHEQHQELLARAEKLGLEIDMNNDFEGWLGKQLRAFNRQLERIETGSLTLKKNNDNE